MTVDEMIVDEMIVDEMIAEEIAVGQQDINHDIFHQIKCCFLEEKPDKTSQGLFIDGHFINRKFIDSHFINKLFSNTTSLIFILLIPHFITTSFYQYLI